VTPLKSQTDFTRHFSPFKGKIQQKYFNGKYPHTIQARVLEAEKVGGCLDLIFGFSGVNEKPLKPILATFAAIISANTMPYTVKKKFLKIQEYIHEGANQKLIVPEFSEFNFQEFFHEN
jgi:hypothetical protein